MDDKNLDNKMSKLLADLTVLEQNIPTVSNTPNVPKATNTFRQNRRRKNKNKNRGLNNTTNNTSININSDNTLQIIPLGGTEEIGKNCTVIRYGNDIIVVDMGLQFPPFDVHGVQYIIPDYTYLLENKDKIRGILITHAHLDHVGAIPFIIKQTDLSVPIYGSALTLKIIERRQEECGGRLILKTVKPKERLTLGKFDIEFFHVNHTIPGCLGMAIRSPNGTVVAPGDWKIDHTPVGDKVADLGHIGEIGKRGVLALLGESTNAYKEGFQKSESEVMRNMEKVYLNSPGRIIVGTFASSLSRIQQTIILAEKYGRKLFFTGYSMRTNVEIAKELKYFKYNQDVFINREGLRKYPDNKIVIACTGVQGESNAALGKIVSGKHPDIRIKKGDNIIFSSSVIPGNEQPIQYLLDKIYKQGGKVINIEEMAVHAGGHAKQEEVKIMYSLLKPKYYIPVHGSYYLLAKHRELILSTGHPDENIIIPENGSIIEFKPDQTCSVRKQKLDLKFISIKGQRVGDIGEAVLKEKITLADHGAILITGIIGKNSKSFLTKPKILFIGLIEEKFQENLHREVEKVVYDTIEHKKYSNPKEETDFDQLLKRKVQQIVKEKFECEPLVISQIVEI